ncbi:hypothetical protein [Arthrobacter sp. CP30]
MSKHADILGDAIQADTQHSDFSGLRNIMPVMKLIDVADLDLAIGR